MKRTMMMVSALTACGDRPEVFEEPLDVAEPVALTQQVAYLDRTRERAIFVRPSVGAAEVHVVETGHAPAAIVPTVDRRAVVVLSRGLESTDPDFEDQEPRLQWIDAQSGETRTYALGSPFDRVTLSEDGRYALAFYGAEPGGEGIFRNPNEVSLIDLAAEPSASNPVARSVRAFGQAPKGVFFSPPLCIPAAPNCADARTLAVVLAAGSLTLLDATNPERREISVLLQVAGAPVLDPEEIIFAPDQGAIFARVAGTSDIFALTLQLAAPKADSDNDYLPVINQLTAGENPTDIAFYDDAGARKVLAVNAGSRDVSVIDAATSSFVRIPVGDPIDTALLFPEEAPTTALLFARQTRLETIYFLDLARLDRELGRNLHRVDLTDSATDIQLVPGGERAIIVHDAGRTVISLIDLRERTFFPLQGSLPLSTYDFAEAGRYLVAATQSLPRVGIVDLDTLHPAEVRLDAAPSKVLALSGSGAVVVHHESRWGEMTILPNALARRDDAVVLRGFLYDDLFVDRLEDIPVERGRESPPLVEETP